MDSSPPNQTLRVPPAVGGNAGELANRLRERRLHLDEVSRARMERQLVQAWRTHGAAGVDLPRARRTTTSIRVPRGTWMASLAGAAVAGALVAAYMFAGDRTLPVAQPSGAHFELRIGDAAVQSGALTEGQVLESGKHGRIDVDLVTARVHMEHDTRMRFDRVTASELVLSMQKGKVDVDFHPVHKGEQRMAIESLAARVQVVGTRFSVQVDALGNTDVRVTEGVVEVVPRSGAEVRRVAAGEETYVRVDDGDEYERAVRNAIAQNVDSLADPAPAGEPAAAMPKPDMDFSAEADIELPTGDSGSGAAARKLSVARRQLRLGHHVQARARLRDVAESSAPMALRLEALTLTAESYTAQGDIERAAQAYEHAAELAPTNPAGHNARFALGRLLERYAHDGAGAASAYRRYLERAPQGALSAQARQALCRLGDASYCDEE
jgi:hypothetical protein